MPYTKTALLIFGIGLAAGFVAVVGEIPQLERASSITMALGVAGLPIGLFADGRGLILVRWLARKLSRNPPPKTRSRSRTPGGPPKPGNSRAAQRPRARSAPARARRKRR